MNEISPKGENAVRRDVFVTVLCPVREASAYLAKRIHALSDVLQEHYQYYEIIVIDNASTDATGTIAKDLLSERKNIQYCALSYRVNDSVAVAAGMERAIGDFVVTIELPVDPPEFIPDMVARSVGGAEIVYGLPRRRMESKTIYDRLSRLFLRVIARVNNVSVPEAMSTYRVFSRSVLNYILDSADYHRTLALAPALSGYRYESLPYDQFHDAPNADRRLGFQAVLKAIDLTLATSVRPLRIASLASVAMSALSIIYAIYIVFVRFLLENVQPGWATLSLQVSVLFFLVSIVLAVMCEYLLQIFETTNRRPVYHIVRDGYSSTMDYKQELNVRDVDKVKR